MNRREFLGVLLITALLGSIDSNSFASPRTGTDQDRAAAAPAALPSVLQRNTKTEIVQSAEGLDYRIFISAPVGPPPPQGFPVLFVLDANAWFGISAEITRLYELEGGPAIVVGVGYPVDSLYAPHRRAHDFTKSAPVTGELGPYKGADFGGADGFIDFLRQDLRDHIGQLYEIDQSRQSLFGHSLGGYFVLYALLTQPDAFAAYVAGSPAIWWDPAILNTAIEAATDLDESVLTQSVLLTAGGAEQELGAADANLLRKMHAQNPAMFGGKPIDEVLAEARQNLRQSGMVDNARDFAEKLADIGIPADFVVFDNENHRSSVPSALSRAMPYFFLHSQQPE